MTMPRPLLIGVALVAFCAVAARGGGASDGAPALGAGQFDRLHALIKPQPAELKWEAIPWGASLWDARQTAAAAGKPIVLWEMDGHPLGCV